MKNTGLGYTHYTFSAWQTKEGASLVTQIRIYTYQDDKLLNCSEVKNALEEKGQFYDYK